LLARFFVQAGYFVYILDHFSISDFYHPDPYGHYVFDDSDMKFLSRIPADANEMLFCRDDASLKVYDCEFRKIIEIDYDMPTGASFGAEIMPYMMHPNAYRENTLNSFRKLRISPRNIKIFFAGNLNRDIYGKSSAMLPGGLTRVDIVDAVLAEFCQEKDTCLISRADEILRAMDRGHSSPLIIFNATESRISRDKWLKLVSSCNFFLCLPGVLMPMSHNIIESMAVGTIPIFNYPDWIHPKPVHGENCLIYKSLEDLFEMIRMVQNLDNGAIYALRKSASRFYDEHLDPSAFLKKIEADDRRFRKLYFCAEFVTEKFSQKRIAEIDSRNAFSRRMTP